MADHTTPERASTTEFYRPDLVAVVHAFGLLASATGVVCGIVLASERTSSVCGAGSIREICSSHPNGAIGVAVVALSVALATGLVLLRLLLRSLTPAT